MDSRQFRYFSLPLALLLCAACGALQSQRAEVEEPESVPSFDVEHYAIELTLLPDERRIEGNTVVRLFATEAGLSHVELHFEGLTVRSVADVDAGALAYTHVDGVLAIELAAPRAVGELIELSIAYGGEPTTGLWFSGERVDGSGPTQVFTQGQAAHSRGWFPCFDEPSDRATTELRVTMPSDWIAVAPGERLERTEDVPSGTVTEHWRMTMPHATYLASLVAGEFVIRERDWNGVPISFLAEPRYEDWIEASFHDTDEILEFLVDYTGVPYPYAKYSQAAVANFPWGGMENISATTLTPLTLEDELGHRDGSSTPLIVHEAAHQWFGDLVTCDNWEHLWLNEGFATYFEYLYAEHVLGTDEMRARVRNAQQDYINGDQGADRRAIVWNTYKDAEDLFTVHPYQGAAVRLHLLRFILGDDVFQQGVRTYLAEFAGRNVVTPDLRRVFEKVSGRDLGDFFDQWFEHAGYPEFRTTWDWSERAGELEFKVRQLQTVVPGGVRAFRVPVEIEVLDATGTRRHRIEVTQRNETFRLPAEFRPIYVRFDTGGWIPKSMEWKRSPSAWLAIAVSDEDVNGRRDAMRALGALAKADRLDEPIAHETYVIQIVDRLQRDRSPYVRIDAAAALGRAGGSVARTALVGAAGEQSDARVRTAALKALQGFGTNADLASFARRCFDEGYSWRTMGAAAQLVCTADPATAYGWISSKLFIDSPHDQLCGELLMHLGSLDNPGVNEQLLRWARDEAVHPSARAIAVAQLARQHAHQGKNARALRDLLGQENFRLNQAIIEALAAVDTDITKAALRAHYPKARTSEAKRAIEAALVGRRR